MCCSTCSWPAESDVLFSLCPYMIFIIYIYIYIYYFILYFFVLAETTSFINWVLVSQLEASSQTNKKWTKFWDSNFNNQKCRNNVSKRIQFRCFGSSMGLTSRVFLPWHWIKTTQICCYILQIKHAALSSKLYIATGEKCEWCKSVG